MKNFFPIENGFTHEIGDLVDLHWSMGKLIADFAFPPDDDHWLRVHFDAVEIIRIVDEMPLSTEEEWWLGTGHVRGHFAYRVEGAAFWNSQSEAFREAYKTARHYQFVTTGMCLDVIAETPPSFSLVPARWQDVEVKN